VSFIANNRVVFNIKGNDYRLVVAVHYNRRMMFVRFIGTHRERLPFRAAPHYAPRGSGKRKTLVHTSLRRPQWPAPAKRSWPHAHHEERTPCA